MPRPRLCRKIESTPEITYFKPAGVGLRELQQIILGLEEYEAVRLCDLEKLNQEDCASRMHVSQPTFHRMISSARSKIADALINGKSIRINRKEMLQ